MKTYISILRGINVGSHKRIKMDSLRVMYENLGFKNIQIYIQSGNILFQCPEQPQRQIESLLEQRIQQQFGFEVPVIILDQMTLNNIIKNNPYSTDVDSTLLHVTILSSIPEQKNLDKISQENYLPELYTINNQFIYLYCVKGYGNTKLTNTFFESKLQVKASTRNWKTLVQLFKMVGNLGH